MPQPASKPNPPPANRPESDRQSWSKAAWIAVALWVGLVVALQLLSRFAARWSDQGVPTVSVLAVNAVGATVAMIGLALIGGWRIETRRVSEGIERSHPSLMRRISMRVYLLLAAVLFPVNWGANLAAQLIVGVPSRADQQFTRQTWELIVGDSLFLGWLCGCLLPALGEEIFFRGYLGRALIERWGTIVGCLVTSFLFAVTHREPSAIVATFLLGMMFQLTYLSTRSLVAAIVLHAANNTLTIGLLLHTRL